MSYKLTRLERFERDVLQEQGPRHSELRPDRRLNAQIALLSYR